VESTGGVDDHDVGAGSLRLRDAVLRDLDRVASLRPHGHPGLAAQRPELLHGRRPLEVRPDQERALPFRTEVLRELRARGGLARPLNAGEHHDGGRRAAQDEGVMLPTERDGELLVHDLHDLLRRRETLQDFLGQGTLADASEEVVGDLDRDVRLEQCHPDLAERVVHLLGVQLAPAAELREDAIQAVGQRVEHSWVAGYGIAGGRRPSVSADRTGDDRANR
jgi:hypothetical protein